MHTIPEDVKNLLADFEKFIVEVLKAENLSKRAKEKKDALIKKIQDVKYNYPNEFQDKGDSDNSEENDEHSSGPTDSTSDRYDKEDEGPSDGHQMPPIAAQDLPSVFKNGYLEKRRKDHSFFAAEWQRRWCALSNNIFYYYGSEKDKQQKGEFAIDGYTVVLNNTLRKDAKKDCCFEMSAPDKRIYQFAASSKKEADEWVKQIKFVLQDMASDIIPEDDDEGETYDDVDHPRPVVSSDGPIDDELYEELPEEQEPKPPPVREPEPEKQKQGTSVSIAVDKSTDYGNFYQGLWDCIGDQVDELSFKRGDVIYILSKEYQTFGWWVGELKGNVGIVPKAYLMEMYDI
ncbi:src kinase-associated phosphoprotein 2 isoform X2 [Protopterus annectens]|uniref:src kinase-associated phosphoprotein 2 isoform X2 n=1 Tax=Protopterus annectens TaxID=7888 RepID=UPI001CFA56CC|nr:src kinase-associated phosphoprotein 2 isoform X2 [Protopterus annectens]